MYSPTELSKEIPTDLWYVPVKALGKGKAGRFNVRQAAELAAIAAHGEQVSAGEDLANDEIRIISKKILQGDQSYNEADGKTLVGGTASGLMSRWAARIRRGTPGAVALGEHPEWISGWIEAGLNVMAGDSHIEPYLQSLSSEERNREIWKLPDGCLYLKPGNGLQAIELALMHGTDALGEVIDRSLADKNEDSRESASKARFWQALAHESLRPMLLKALNKSRVAQMMASPEKEIRLLSGALAASVIGTKTSSIKRAGA